MILQNDIIIPIPNALRYVMNKYTYRNCNEKRFRIATKHYYANCESGTKSHRF